MNLRRNALFSLALVACASLLNCFANGASADPEFYEYRRATKSITLKECAAVDGLSAVSRIFVKDYGRRLELAPDYNRSAYTVTLNPRPRYFACGTEKSSGKVAIFARRSLFFSSTKKIFLTASDFPENPTSTPTPTPTPGATATPTPVATATPAPTPPPGAVGCSTYKTWPGAFIYKTLGSTHFSPSDPRRTAIGLVMKRGAKVPTPSCIDVLASNGKPIAQMGLYQKGNGWHARYYGGIGCGTQIGGAGLGALATKEAGNSNIYMRIGTTCYGQIDATKCTGSSQC